MVGHGSSVGQPAADFLSRLQVAQQTLITNTFPIGGATVGPQNANIFIVDLSEVPLGFG